MNVRPGAAALLLLIATALSSCGEGSSSADSDAGSTPTTATATPTTATATPSAATATPTTATATPSTATATPGATDPGKGATTPPPPVTGDIKACELLTEADAERVIGGPVAHPGETDQERQANATDTICAWAPPGQPYIFDKAPAVVAIIANDAAGVQQFKSPENRLEKVDVAGYVGYLSPEKDNNTGYVLVLIDDDTLVQFGAVRVAANSQANAELAADLGRTVLKRIG